MYTIYIYIYSINELYDQSLIIRNKNEKKYLKQFIDYIKRSPI